MNKKQPQKTQKPSKKEKEQKELLGFLSNAKEGKYAQIDASSLKHSRRVEENGAYSEEDEYYFSVR
jgi:hypothetical protein